MAATLNLIQLYINVLSKKLVSVSGSPTEIPPLFYGDVPTFFIYPVIPVSSNPNQGYTTIDMTGYTMNLTMAGTPNAANPPAPFAALDGMGFTKPSSGYGYYTGDVDMTQDEVKTFIGANASQQAYFNLDVAPVNAKRATLLQVTFQLNASIDTVVAGPPANPNIYLTANQIRNLFVPKSGAPGESFILQSEDGTKKAQVYLGDDGGLKTPTVN